MKEFKSFAEQFKYPQEGSTYADMPYGTVSFDSDSITLSDPHNFELIIEEMNKVPATYFQYRMIMEQQTKVLQQLEEEYNRWYAEKWLEIDKEMEPKTDKTGAITGYKRIERTEGAKEKLVISRYSIDYYDYKQKLSHEKYKLGLIKACVSAIDSYSFKLHSILNYKQMLVNKLGATN